MFKNFKSVERCVIGKGAFGQLAEILSKRRVTSDDYIVFIVDKVFENGLTGIKSRIPSEGKDMVIWADVNDHEPTTEQVDEIRDNILAQNNKRLPAGVVGIGGGSVMDIAKATSLMLCNEGSSQLYQGLNLVKKPGVWHCGVPTIAGTGAEVSMTAVLTGPTKKLGLKCDWTIFDQIVLDPELVADVPTDQWFYTGMDSYIHCVESLTGTLNNEFSRAFGEKSLELCQEVYMKEGLSRLERDEKLMIASYMGGLSLTYSEVGVCHALSYGLSYVFGYRHGIANCIAFDVLEDYYGKYVDEFRAMVKKHNVTLPKNLSKGWTEEQIQKMVDITIALEHMWNHAVGKDWKEKVTREQIAALFRRM
ncbi:MAG TPA: iron-containing alcohol dehydrogenase family protein [Cytophagales bacterium]|nr:iron-containing alcohol dehydrogenase family protein [Cytophagales bacterium]